MADETTDMSNREQVVLCICWVTKNFEVREDFIGLYVVQAIDAKTLFLAIKDVLQRLNLSLKKARVHCYDVVSRSQPLPLRVDIHAGRGSGDIPLMSLCSAAPIIGGDNW